MIYFCADDYGICHASNQRIEYCLKHGALNKISVLPNGEFEDFKQHISENGATLSLHINLVEGHPLSSPQDIPLLVTEHGSFRHSFVGLLRLSLGRHRRQMEAQVYQEIRRQLCFWKEVMGADVPVSLDSHQHTHMIPMIFRALMRAIRDEQMTVAVLRIPAEPLSPYILSPSLYTSYKVTGLIKQWLLKFLHLVNRREWKKAGIPAAYFMGAVFSGRLTEEKIRVLLPRYIKLAEKRGRDIEVALHPGFLENGERLMDGCQASFERFYFSEWRKKEYETLLNFTLETTTVKEGTEYAVH